MKTATLVIFQPQFVKIQINSCELPLSKESGDEGAVYSADFQTAFGGDLTVKRHDGFDSAEDRFLLCR